MCTVKSNHGELGALDCLEGELKLTRYWSVCVIIPLGSLGGGSCGLRGVMWRRRLMAHGRSTAKTPKIALVRASSRATSLE